VKISTLATINPEYRDADIELTGSRVDYGLFLTLEDSISSSLAGAQGDFPFVHMSMPDPTQTPLAVSIETKSLNGRAAEGPTQLATWARAQFRHLNMISLPRRLRLPAVEEMPIQDSRPLDSSELQPTPATSAGLAQTTREFNLMQAAVSAGYSRELPVLPLAFVFGNEWRVSFAQRVRGETVSSL